MRAGLTAAFAMGVGLAASALGAETISTKNRVMLFGNQTKVLDSRAAQQYNDSVRLKPPTVVTPTKWGPSSNDGTVPVYRGHYNGPYASLARVAARKHGVPEDLFLRLVRQESNFNPKARSHKGAVGLAQLMPDTARYLGVDPHDITQNLEGGARYLMEQFRTFRSWPLALAAYNAGPGAVQKHGGIPPYRETRDYVRKIWGR